MNKRFEWLKQKRWLGYLLVFLIIFGYFGSLARFNIHRDDLYFWGQMNLEPVGKFLHQRYFLWSPRLIPDLVGYYIFHIPIWLFDAINAGFLILLSYSCIRIVTKKITPAKLMILPLVMGYLSFGILDDGYLWLSGSFNYLWPAAISMYLLIPFADSYLNNEPVNWTRQTWLRLILSVIFIFTNEQFVLAVAGVAIFYLIGQWYQHKKFSIPLIINTVIYLIGLMIFKLSPANAHRYNSEMKSHFPEFSHLSLVGHLRVGINWLFGNLYSGFIPLFILITVLAIILIEDKKTIWIGWFIGVLSISVLFKPISNFDFLMKTHGFSITNIFRMSLPYLFWGCVILSVIVLCMNALAEHPMIILLCFVGAFATSALLWFSPTIYISGLRVFNAPSIFLFMVVFALLAKIKKNGKPSFKPLLFLVTIYPIVAYLVHLYTY